MTTLFKYMAQQTRINFDVSIKTTFRSRLARLLRLRIFLHSEATEESYFRANESAIIKSIISLITRAIVEDTPIRTLIKQYPRLKEGKYLAPDELDWMQSICDEVRPKIGPLPLHLDHNPEAYLPSLHWILRELEDYSSKDKPGAACPEDLKKTAAHCKLFTLLPQKHIRPINIKIVKTALRQLCRSLYGDIPLNDEELWSFFSTSRRCSCQRTRSLQT
jgi:hypothetical protein